MSDTPLYDKAKKAAREYKEANLGQPTLEQWAAMAVDFQLEHDAEIARARAERNLKLILAGAWEIREELEAAGIALEYRQAVYKERLGVRKGEQAYLLMKVSI